MKFILGGMIIGMVIGLFGLSARIEQKTDACQTAALSADRIINEDSDDDRDYKAFNESRDACIM